MTHTTHAVRLNCSSTGSPANPNLVILHGLFGDLNNWKGIAQRFSDRYHVHCMDLRNHGDSPHTKGMSYPEMASDVALTTAELGIKTTYVIGHSMGGKTAMQLALQNADLISKLVVVDISPRRYGRHHEPILNGMKLLSDSIIDSRKQADELLQPYVPEAGIRSFLLKNLKRTDNGQYKMRINIDEIASRYDEIATNIESEQQFTKPVLFIKGAASNYLTTTDKEPIAALFKKPSLKTIDGAGHWPHSEKPDVIYKILSDFLKAD